MENKKLPVLKPVIKQLDLFLCDLSDAILKDDMASMEHPIFTLSKKPDIKIRRFEHNGNILIVTPSVIGHATIYDKDILIYAISKLMKAKENGELISKKIVFDAHECLKFIHRTQANGNAGGADFRRLEKSLRRLKGTMIETNIKTGGKSIKKGFNIIDEYIVEREDFDKGRVLTWGVILSDWIYNSILSNEVLTLHHDYFRLRKPLEKRVYEIVRRHCGKKKQWKISTELLLKKSGASSSIKEFRRMINHIVKNDHLPDYHIKLDENDTVIFTKKSGSKVGKITKKEKDIDTSLADYERFVSSLPDRVLDQSKSLARAKNRDYRTLVKEFLEYAKQSEPKNIIGAFLGFIKHKDRL